MTCRTKVLALAVALVLAAAPNSLAQNEDVEVLFVQTDENDDGLISQTEFLKIAIIQFQAVDTNQDDKLDKKEVGEASTNQEFTDNDADRDGKLSLKEVVDEKLADFATADRNKDGTLDLDEVQKAYQQK